MDKSENGLPFNRSDVIKGMITDFSNDDFKNADFLNNQFEKGANAMSPSLHTASSYLSVWWEASDLFIKCVG